MIDWITSLSNEEIRWLDALVVFVVGLLLVPLLMGGLSRMTDRLKVSKAMQYLTIRLARIVLYILLMIAVLYQAGLTGLAATLSGSFLLISVALSQAFKDLLQDIIAGFSIAKDKDFEVGFTIQIGSTKGVIKRVGARKVRLIDPDGYTRVLPNSGVEKSEWIVLDRESTLKETKRKT